MWLLDWFIGVFMSSWKNFGELGNFYNRFRDQKSHKTLYQNSLEKFQPIVNKSLKKCSSFCLIQTKRKKEFNSVLFNPIYLLLIIIKLCEKKELENIIQSIIQFVTPNQSYLWKFVQIIPKGARELKRLKILCWVILYWSIEQNSVRYLMQTNHSIFVLKFLWFMIYILSSLFSQCFSFR